MSSRSQYTQIFSVAPSNRGLIGALIGKGGAKIRETTSTSGCQNIHYDRSQSQFVIEGSPSAVARAINVLGEQMAYQAARQEDRSYAEPTQKTFHVRFQNTKESAPAPSRRTNMYAALKGSDGRNIETIKKEQSTAARHRVEEDEVIEQAWAPKHEPEKMGYDEWAAKAAAERTALADMLAKTKSSGENATGIKRKRGVELAKVKGATHQKKPRLEDQTMWPELAKQTPRKTKTKTKNSGRKPVQIIISETGPSQFVRDSRSRHRDACAKASKVWTARQKTRSETPDKDPEEQAQRRAEQEEYLTKRDAYLKAHPDAVAPKRIQIESWADRIGLQSNLTEQDISNIDEFFAQQHTAGSVSMVPYMSESA
jgi:hypothetical protein